MATVVDEVQEPPTLWLSDSNDGRKTKVSKKLQTAQSLRRHEPGESDEGRASRYQLAQAQGTPVPPSRVIVL